MSSLPSPCRKSRTTLLAVHSVIIMTRGPVLTPKRLRLGVNTAEHRVMRTCLNWYQKLGPALTNNNGRDLPAPLSSPTRATLDPDDSTAVGSLRSTSDQASSDSDSSKEDVANSDMDTTSRDCITCSDTDEVTIWTSWKKHQKRVWASYRLSKDSLWTEAQLKWISDSCQAVWGHNHESIQREWDHTLTEDHNSFEMHRMMVRTNQLLCIAVASNSQIYTRDSEAKAHSQAKTLVLLLKQYHERYYHFYEEGMTMAMIGLQGLHLSNAVRHSNISSSVELKSFCPWCFKLGGQHWNNSHPSEGSALPFGHCLWPL